MAANDSKGGGDLGEQRPQARSSVPAGKPTETAAPSKRGNTVGKSTKGPTELPAQFGRYRVIKKLGGGGMGTVYLVENTELEREEALKVPHFGDGDDAHARERFLRETKSAAKLDHANLCPVYSAGVQDGIYYLTMRFLEGKLLSDFTGKAQPARKAVEIAAKLAQALEAAHAKGVIHRDLKPGNVMMVASVGPVVMDFGLAKQVRQADQKLTQAGSMLGTPSYMPPEQVNGDLERMGPASDVYSLGVILYQLLTGRLPFKGTMAAILGQILYAEPPAPSALVPGLSPALDGICRKAMAKASAERYPSMDAFAAALLDYLRAMPATEDAGTLAPTAGDEAAVFQVATAGFGRPPTGNSDDFPAPGVAPLARQSLPSTPREAKAPTMLCRPDGARKTSQKAGATGDKGKSTRPIRVGRTVGIALAVGGVSLGIFCCILVSIVIVITSKGSSMPPGVSKGGQSQLRAGAAGAPRANAAMGAGKSKAQAISPPATESDGAIGVLPVGSDGKPLNFDFETGTLKDWTAEGEAFVNQPIEGDTVYRRLAHANIKSQHQGRYWIGTFENAGDGPQGTLTSMPFKVTHPRASFLVGGGPGPATCVELVRKDTGEVFSRTSGSSPPIETMRRVTVDLRPVLGEEIFIRLVDRDSGGWGHINFDDFRFHE